MYIWINCLMTTSGLLYTYLKKFMIASFKLF